MSTKFFESKKSGGSKSKGSGMKVAIIGTLALCLTAGAGFGAYKLIQSGVDRASNSGSSISSNNNPTNYQSNPSPVVQNRTFFDNMGAQNKTQATNNTSKAHHKASKNTHSRHGKKIAKHKSKHSRHFAKHSKKKHGKHLAKYSKKKHKNKMAKKSKSKHHRELASANK